MVFVRTFMLSRSGNAPANSAGHDARLDTPVSFSIRERAGPHRQAKFRYGRARSRSTISTAAAVGSPLALVPARRGKPSLRRLGNRTFRPQCTSGCFVAFQQQPQCRARARRGFGQLTSVCKPAVDTLPGCTSPSSTVATIFMAPGRVLSTDVGILGVDQGIAVSVDHSDRWSSYEGASRTRCRGVDRTICACSARFPV